MDSNTLSNETNFNSKNVLLLGAADGIGHALSEILEKKNYNVYVTSRKKNSSSSKIKYFQLMATQEESWLKFTKVLDEKKIVFDLIINTIGVLQDKENDVIPEKSIKDLNSASFIKNIEANTLTTALCIKYLVNYTSKNQNVVIANLSARLGSISDNNIGGWISYRASKAAQHMIIKTASIEFKRTNKNLILIGLHPGTVKTKLSDPFVKSAKKIFSAHESGINLLKVIEETDLNSSGKIYDFSGKIIPY
jgi:NAD(P)-dependent dehydrogenase (short-subunit alcohol dehydrogenase family)